MLDKLAFQSVALKFCFRDDCAIHQRVVCQCIGEAAIRQNLGATLARLEDL